MSSPTLITPRRSHVFAKEANGHYVEEQWCARRLFEVEAFGAASAATILDPFCGWGRIPQAAIAAGYQVLASDIVDRGARERVPGLDFRVVDFFDPRGGDVGVRWPLSIVTNPPFDRVDVAIRRALEVATFKVAMIALWRRLPAARWLSALPLYHIWLMTPRPSMPPGSYIEAGGKVGGGTQDFCWLVFLQGYDGEPEVRCLRREPQGAGQ